MNRPGMLVPETEIVYTGGWINDVEAAALGDMQPEKAKEEQKAGEKHCLKPVETAGCEVCEAGSPLALDNG